MQTRDRGGLTNYRTITKVMFDFSMCNANSCAHARQIPFRSYQRDIIRTEPLIYRLEEAMLHYGIGTNVHTYAWIKSWTLVYVCETRKEKNKPNRRQRTGGWDLQGERGR